MARPYADLPADVSFREAGYRILHAGFEMLRQNIEGTRQGDIDALHDMRVASRRLRAALSVFAGLFPRSEFAEIESQVVGITRALGAVRDLDVLLVSLHALSEGLPENEAYGLERVIARQEKRRLKERKALRKALDQLERDRFERRFQRALSRLAPEPNPSQEGA